MKRKNQSFWTFCRYASLNVLGMLGLSCYILADTFFVAQGLGSKGLTALNLAIPIYSFIHGLGLMVGMGGATRFSIVKENGDKHKINSIFSQSILFMLLICSVLVLMGVFFSGELSTLLGADQEVHEMTDIYLKVILIFSPMFLLNNIMICFVRNDNNPKLAMKGMLAGSFSNIVLDYIFIFPFQMGMFGAVLATGIAPVVSLFMLSAHFIKKKNNFNFVRVGLKLKFIKDTVLLGATSLITEVSSGIVIIIFNILILGLQGNIGVAAYGIVANLALVVVAIFNGVSQGIQPIVSFEYGKGNLNHAKTTYRYAMVTVIAIAAIIYIIAMLFDDPLIAIFNREGNVEMAKIAKHGLSIYFIGFFFLGVNLLTATYFSSIDKAVKSFTISIMRGFAVIIPMAFLLSGAFHMTGIWLAVPVTELIVSGIVIYFIRKPAGNERIG